MCPLNEEYQLLNSALSYVRMVCDGEQEWDGCVGI